MENINSAVATLIHGSNTLFILLGAIMVLAMHAGFAFLEVGTVRQKNQVNALSKILSDFAISALAYFFIGYWIAYGINFLEPAAVLTENHGYGLVKFFFLLTFAAAIPAIISGGIAERAKFGPQLCATALIVAFVYPFFEGMIWNGNYGFQAWLEARFGAGFHDFAGSVVVHAMGGWLALALLLAVLLWLSFIYGLYNGAMIPALTEIMPTEVRVAGFSLAYSLATAVFGEASRGTYEDGAVAALTIVLLAVTVLAVATLAFQIVFEWVVGHSPLLAQLPAAKAAAIWPVKMARGKFHGLMQANTPRGGAVRASAPAA